MSTDASVNTHEADELDSLPRMRSATPQRGTINDSVNALYEPTAWCEVHPADARLLCCSFERQTNPLQIEHPNLRGALTAALGVPTENQNAQWHPHVTHLPLDKEIDFSNRSWNGPRSDELLRPHRGPRRHTRHIRAIGWRGQGKEAGRNGRQRVRGQGPRYQREGRDGFLRRLPMILTALSRSCITVASKSGGSS